MLDKIGHSLLHGTGCNRWFDKAVSLVVFSNSKVRWCIVTPFMPLYALLSQIGFNVEHSW